jgi:hypothetical protein
MVSNSFERYLQPGVALRKVYEVLEPNLIYTDYVEILPPEPQESFIYGYQSTNVASDAKIQYADLGGTGAPLPEVDFTLPSTASGQVSSKGFQFRITHSLKRKMERADNFGMYKINDLLGKAAVKCAEIIDTAIFTAMSSGATTSFSTFSPAAVWSADGADPITDLEALAQDMDREGYPFRQSDVIVNKAGFYELKNYLTFIDGRQFDPARVVGKANQKDMIYVGQADTIVHKDLNNMTDGYIMAVDQANKGAEMHVFADPEFSMPAARIKYKTIENGKPVSKSMPNLGLNMDSYVEQDTKDTVVQLWFENSCVVTQPYGISFGSGI